MVVTFYSFKGGVGRSMALANIARWFQRCGLDAVIIDWDPEVPGIESFFVGVDPGLPPNATDVEIDAYIRRVSGSMRSLRAPIVPGQPDPLAIIDRLIADRNQGAKS